MTRWPEHPDLPTQRIAPGFGLHVDLSGAPARTVPDADLRQALARHGVVHLRGALADIAAFEQWSRAVCPGFVRHASPVRTAAGLDGATWTDVHGQEAMPAHIERGYAFPVPEVLFVYCRRAAGRGGEITVHDGFEVYAALPPDARATLSRTRLRWRLRVGPHDWTAMFGTDDVAKALSRFHRQILSMPVLEQGAGVRASTEGQRLVFDYQTPATCRAERRPGEALANSILVHRLEHAGAGDAIELTDEHGHALPDDLMAQVAAAAARTAQPIELRDGDLLCIDNRSVMHGRRAFADARREVYVRAGFRASVALPRMRQYEPVTDTPAPTQARTLP